MHSPHDIRLSLQIELQRSLPARERELLGQRGQAERHAVESRERQIHRLIRPIEGAPRFHLLHRRRIYNESEGCWMGWERKRGKLHELNLMLRGDSDTTFMTPETPLPVFDR